MTDTTLTPDDLAPPTPEAIIRAHMAKTANIISVLTGDEGVEIGYTEVERLSRLLGSKDSWLAVESALDQLKLGNDEVAILIWSIIREYRRETDSLGHQLAALKFSGPKGTAV